VLAGGSDGRVIVPLWLDPLSLTAPTDARTLRTTDEAVRGIAAIMAKSFGLPVPHRVVVHVYGGRRAFEQGLMRDARVSPVQAATLSDFAIGVGTRGQMLLNDQPADRTERERLRLIAHELVHVSQIELAGGGVLFLDEVSEMSPSAQAKFLRVLQEREFQRLGGTRTQKANVRIVAATNRDLKKAVERGDFREDLYYRLQVFDIRIAPLRERREDILHLSDAFLEEIGKSFGRPPAGLTRDAREALLNHDWPGNVRQLRNALERAAILCEGGLISARHLSLETPARARPATTDLNVVERDTIAQVMHDAHWNKSQAAKRLGLSRTQLYGRLRKYNLDRPPAA